MPTLFVVGLLAVADGNLAAQSAKHLSHAEGKALLDQFSRQFDDSESWQRLASTVRAGILSGMRLSLPGDRQAPRAVIHSRRDMPGYSVENIALETHPGFYLTGNLYRPRGSRAGSNQYAAVLCPHGHFQPRPGIPGGRFREEMQRRCATLARMGAVVLSYDMVGWGESTQMKHSDKYALTMQTWNSLRAVDYLTARDDVEGSRVGVTGASGGGTQSFLLAAVDRRVRVSVPVVMVSAHFFGGCNCESGLPIHASARHRTNNADIAALAAPRPQLLISVTWRGPANARRKDQSCNTPDVEFPYLRRVYGLLGRADQVENLHLEKEGHDYGYSKRVGMYRFMAKHLGLDLSRVTSDDGKIDESFVRLIPQDQLYVWDASHSRPATALQGAAAIEASFFGAPSER